MLANLVSPIVVIARQKMVQGATFALGRRFQAIFLADPDQQAVHFVVHLGQGRT